MKYLLPALLYSAIAMGAARADIVTYNVSIDSDFLTTLGPPFSFPPYYLDFQFIAGDTSEPTPNTVAVTSTGGQFTSFDLTAGPVPGSGENIVSFTPADPTTFTLSFTENVEPEPAADLLSIYICDGTLINCVTTDDPLGFDTVVDFTESLDPANPGISEVDVYDTPTNDLNTSALLVQAPEPRTWLTSSLGALGSFLWIRRRLRSSSPN